MSEQHIEKFEPTSGQFTGWVGAVVGLATAVFAGIVGHLPTLLGALLFTALVWAATLKPRLRIEGDQLVLRNMLETVRIPLAGIEQLASRQVFAVRTAHARYVSTAVGRSWRKALASNRNESARISDRIVPTSGTAPAPLPGPAGGGIGEGMDYADYVEERVREAIAAHRVRLGIAAMSEESAALGEQVRREPAWAEIVLIGVLIAAYLASLVL